MQKWTHKLTNKTMPNKFLTKEAKMYSRDWGKIYKIISHLLKNKIEFVCFTLCKINSKWITYFNLKPKTLKLLKYIGNTLQYNGIDKNKTSIEEVVAPSVNK